MKIASLIKNIFTFITVSLLLLVWLPPIYIAGIFAGIF